MEGLRKTARMSGEKKDMTNGDREGSIVVFFLVWEIFCNLVEKTFNVGCMYIFYCSLCVVTGGLLPTLLYEIVLCLGVL